MLNVLVLSSKFVRGGAGGTILPLDQALSREWSSDAHFVCYDHPVRLKKAQIQDIQPPFACAVFDLDDKDAHAGLGSRKDTFTDTMYEAQMYLSESLKTDVGMYCTRGGGRLVVPYDAPQDPVQHKDFVTACLSMLREGGFEPDDLKDTTRLFRLPKVIRDGKAQDHPEYLEDMVPIHRDRIGAIVASWKLSGNLSDNVTQSRFTLPDTIGSGDRNTTLTSYAGQLRRRGMEYEGILSELTQVNAQRVNPPLSSDELEAIAGSVSSYEPASPNVVQDTETGEGINFDIVEALGHGSEQCIADAVVQVWDTLGEGTLLYDRNRLWSFDGIRWIETSEYPLSELLRNFDGHQFVSGRNADGSIRFGVVKVSNRLYDSILSIIRRNHWNEDFFNDAPIGLAFEDGFLDARTLTLKPNHPDNRALTSVPMVWQASDDTPVLWDETLHDIFAGDPDADAKIHLLEEFVGVGLLGAATKLQRALVLLGAGANGKSTVLEVIEHIFRWSGAKTTALAPQNMENEYNRDMLAGARLNVCNEMPESDILVGSAVKATISGDIQTARKIREAPYAFRPTALQLFAANFLPSVSDSSQGFWRRWCILSFNRAFSTHERDPYRAEKLKSEIDKITRRCVQRGLEALRRGAYSEPKSSIEAVRGWQTQADQIACWVRECSDVLDEDDKDEWSNPTELYESYKTWCSTTGHRAMSKHKFGRRLKELGIGFYVSNAGRRYGCRLKSTQPDLRLV